MNKIDINRLKGHVSNGRLIRIKKQYMDRDRLFEIRAEFNMYNGKIRLKIDVFDVKLDEECGGGLESPEPIIREEIKDFTEVEEVLDYIFKTTTLTEENFPKKFQVRNE